MTHSFPIRRWACRDLEVADASTWAESTAVRLRAGARVVTAFGRGEGDAVVLTAVLQSPDGELEALRGRASRERGYHALTEEFPAMHAFEREIHEQTGLRIAGHPWLKPLRFEHASDLPRSLDSYPFYRIDGKEVHEVQVGPVHAGVIEPGAFRFMCLGEMVHHLEIHLGYQHRGVEALLLRGDPRMHAQLTETIAGDASIAHVWAYSSALESLTDTMVDSKIENSRAVGLELERVAMHLAGLAGLATDIGFLQGAATYGRLRTTAINTSMRLCGSRFGRGWIRPGANRIAVDASLLETVRNNLELLTRDIAIINDRFIDSTTVRHRFVGTGVVTAEQAKDIGLVGMVARASGVALDQRAFGKGVYSDSPLATQTESTGDCWARALVRIHEIDQSLRWLGTAVERLLGLESTRAAKRELLPEQLVVSLCEGWRGEVVHCLETDSEARLLHYKVQDPSLRNWFGLALAVRENEISDFPICNKSFDLSYCGHDL